MTSDSTAILVDALRDPDRLASIAPDWEMLIRRGREADLLGTLASRLAEHAMLDAVPAAPRAHFIAAERLYQAQHAAVRRELEAIAAALNDIAAPVVLLKGAAYLAADLPPARGRMFSDIDILVPRESLARVESALMLAGFATTHLHPYDQRYYRRWMHELPPMRHVKRMTVLDVHHTIVPPTARVALDPRELLRHAVPLRDAARFLVLAPADMVLHSATHLFRNDELSHGLRDLVDLDALLGHFAADNPRFWSALLARSDALDLGRPLYYALRFASRMLGTPIPRDALAGSRRHAPGGAMNALMDALFTRALRPAVSLPSTRWSRRALYVRGHWLRMPLPLLAWHLTYKTFRRTEQPT